MADAMIDAMAVPVMDVPATDDQLEAFRDALGTTIFDTSTPDEVDDMVGKLPVVIVGTLGPAGPGRKAYAGPGAFDAYANLELRDSQVIKGTLPDPSHNAYVEINWPNDVGVDKLVDATPVGARIILLGGHVLDALDEAQRLETEEGIDAVAGVQTNLLQPAPYGLLIEGVDGLTYAPLWGQERPLVVNGADSLTNFEDAVTAIRAAVER